MSAVASRRNAPDSFRAMRYTDLPAVMAIERRAYPFPWSEAVISDCIRVGYRCRVLERGRAILGYGILSIAVGEAHVLNLCVAPEYQGQGLGRRILEHLMEQARQGGARTVFLEVRPSNGVAVHLYRSAGFCEVGLRRGYYPAVHGREDALVMAREL
ncbi:MAG TPA: ribosomal protein S18-alanine N-acetyltransferase [Candidatus Competibacteraceae bacterium]|nr:ribosomal protein S18-alanine N-acetyltransferase [Candidatus Competibacteraceae bacterium]